jgi:hypothetical protein
MINRREFLKNASVLTGAGALSALGSMPIQYGCSRSAYGNLHSYDNRLRDHLWMWGHDTGDYDGPDNEYNIPVSPSISMADAIRYMGIPNVCVIRRSGIPRDEEYNKQFKDVKRIAWALAMGSNKSYQTVKDYVLSLRDKMPNLGGYFLDDFFHLSTRSASDITGPAPAALSMEEMKKLYDETLAYKRRLDLAIVLYTHQLHPSIQPVMQYVDVVSLWIWTGADIQMIEENFKKYRSLVPDKPTLLGIYMWDFGGKKELNQDFMVKQLDYAYKLYKEGQIEGMIFHCTPLVNKNLQAVGYAKEWIAKNGDERR